MTDFPKDLHETVPVAALKAGDTVLLHGEYKTICAQLIGRAGVIAATYSYHSRFRDVCRVAFGAELAGRGRCSTS
jgi:aminoglycoside N3'-acetyltransferase